MPLDDIGLRFVLRPWPEGVEWPYDGPERDCFVIQIVVRPGARAEFGARPGDAIIQASPQCPPGTPGGVDIVGAIVRAVRAWPMPPPAPAIAPGYAITGLPGFLETSLQPSAEIDEPFLAGQLRITAACVVVDVDWGDGSYSRHLCTDAGPYPDGGITHLWKDVGTYTVQATARWEARWSYVGALGTYAGTVTGLRSDGFLPDFEVGQVQAVRIR